MPATASTLILLVEDEALIRLALQDVLMEEGFDVVVAPDGAAAIILLDRHWGELAGLITDIDLGSRTNGWLVANAARGLRPNLPVFYMSGASSLEWPAKGVADSMMFAKPFLLQDLALAATAAMHGGSAAR